MNYEQDRVWQLVRLIPWKQDDVIRLFWLRYEDVNREAFAAGLATRIEDEYVFAVAVRKYSFFDANAVMSDVIDLLDQNRTALEALGNTGISKLTILLIARDGFRMAQTSSLIQLPTWFPVDAGLERSFLISDLGQTAEENPLNCVEARIHNVSELLFALEKALVDKLQEIHTTNSMRTLQFLQAIQLNPQPLISDVARLLDACNDHLTSIADSRAYRIGADGKHLGARIIKLTLNSSPKQLGDRAVNVAASMPNSDVLELRPSFFAIAWRPASSMVCGQSNWHAIFVGMFQAYQLMNGSAHAGEYPVYPVALQYAMSLNLRLFLEQARSFVEAQI